MKQSTTLHELINRELALLDSLGSVVRGMGNEQLAEIVDCVSEAVFLRLSQHVQLVEQAIGCRIMIETDEGGIVDSARLEFSETVTEPLRSDPTQPELKKH